MQGRSPEDIPWRSALGVVGSYVGVFLVCCSLAATFYSSLFVSLQIPFLFSSVVDYVTNP